MSEEQSNDNVIDYVYKLKSQSELREYVRAQFLTLLNANKRVEQLEAENRQLRERLTSLESAKVELVSRSPEQDLCEIEIRRLRDKAMGEALTLEETKRLDLLVKNLYLAKGKPTASLTIKSKNLENISEADLVRLAHIPDNE